MCEEEATQRNIQRLLGIALTNLFADAAFLDTSGKFAVGVISQVLVLVLVLVIVVATVLAVLPTRATTTTLRASWPSALYLLGR